MPIVNVMQEHELKNAYIGERHSSPNSIDLRNSSLSTITSLWWISKFDSPSFDSGWAFSPSNQKVLIWKIVDLSNATKVKITANERIVAGWYYGDVRLSIMSETESNFYNWYTGVQQCSNAYWKIRITLNTSQKARINGSNSTWDYQHILEVNLATWATTYTITWPTTATYTLTSGELSTVKWYTFIGAGYEAAGDWAWSNGHHLRDISLEIE